MKTKLTDTNKRLEEQSDKNSNTSTAFTSAINAKNFNHKKPEKFCSFCKLNGYTRDRCFKLQNKSNNARFHDFSNSNHTKHNSSDQTWLRIRPHYMSADSLPHSSDARSMASVEWNVSVYKEKS